MPQYPEEDQVARLFPLKGVYRGAKNALVPAPYTAYEENTYHDHRSLRKRPFREKVNHTATRLEGISLYGRGLIPWNKHMELNNHASWTVEFTITPEFFPGDTLHWPVLYKESAVAQAAAYDTGSPYTAKQQTVDAPFVFNLATLTTRFFEVYVTNSAGTNYRAAVAAYQGVRQHVSITYNGSTDQLILRSVSNQGTVSNTVSVADANVKSSYLPWTVRGTDGLDADTPLLFENIRFWSDVRTDSEIDDNRDDEIASGTANLLAQWNGRGSSNDVIEDTGGAKIPMYFHYNFPCHHDGAAVLANWDSAIESQGFFISADAAEANWPHDDIPVASDFLNDAYSKDWATSEVGIAAAATATTQSMFIKFTLLGYNDRTATNNECIVLANWPANVIYNPNSGRIMAQFEGNTGVTKGTHWDESDEGLFPIRPGDTVSLLITRDGQAGSVWMNGNANILDWGTGGTVVNPLKGTSIGYGAPTAAGGFASHAFQNAFMKVHEVALFAEDMSDAHHGISNPYNAVNAGDHNFDAFEDKPEIGKTGKIVYEVESGWAAANGSATITKTTGTFVPISGDLMIDTGGQPYSPHAMNVVYRVQAYSAPDITLDTEYQGSTGDKTFAFTKCFYHKDFSRDASWSTESGETRVSWKASRIGNEDYLMNMFTDDFNVIRPMWGRTGAFSATDLARSIPDRRHSKKVGKTLPIKAGTAVLSRYQKEDQLNSMLGVWGNTLYWPTDRWFRKSPDDTSKYSALVTHGDYWESADQATKPMFHAYEAKEGVVHITMDILPLDLNGKRVLVADGGGGSENGRLVIYLDDGRLVARVCYDSSGGSGSTVYGRMETIYPAVREGVWHRVDVYIDFDSSANSYLAIDGEKVNTTGTLFTSWPSTSSHEPNARVAGSQSLFGLNPKYWRELIDAGYPGDKPTTQGYLGFVGYVNQVRISDAEEGTLSAGVSNPGALVASSNTTFLLSLEEGNGWKYANTGLKSTTTYSRSAINTGGPIPILNDLSEGNDDNRYSIDSLRGVAYGTNGVGRQFYAKWTGNFSDGKHGWEADKSGIAAPTNPPRLNLDAGTDSTNLDGDVYQVAYTYLDSSTGLRSNPSPLGYLGSVKGAGSGNARKDILVQELVRSADPRVDKIEIYMTAPAGTSLRLVDTLANGSYGPTLDYSTATIESGTAISYANGVPPAAKFIKFFMGRAYWGGLGEGYEGSVAFSGPDLEESWYALDQLKADPSRWSPITGLGGQRGALHIYTRDAIFRALPGVGDLTTYSVQAAISGTGAINHDGIIDVDGVEYFIGRDGLFAFDGNAIALAGQQVELDIIGMPGWNSEGIDLAKPLFAVWDPSRHTAMWFHSAIGEDDNLPLGKALVMGRRATDDPSWSTCHFYGTKAATGFDDLNGKIQIAMADDMGYVWILRDKINETDNEIDTDNLGILTETGASRPVTGTWGSTAFVAPVAGDGLRGYTFLATRPATGIVAEYQMNRFKSTPALATPAVGEMDEALAFTPTTWYLGGFPQRIFTGWTPVSLIEVPKMAFYLDASFIPQSGESVRLSHYAASGYQKNPMTSLYDSTYQQRKMATMDSGFFDNLDFSGDNRGRAFIFNLDYLGLKSLEMFEMAVRWAPEGAETGPSYTQ